MPVQAILKTIVGVIYRLTVGLTVLLLQAGLLYLLALLTLGAGVALVVLVSWKTYLTTDQHLGWSALAGTLTAAVCGALVVGGHRVARDWLGLTTLGLSDLLRLLFLPRPRPTPTSRAGGGDVNDDSRQLSRHHDHQKNAKGPLTARQRVTVVKRKTQNAMGDGHSTSSTVKITRATVTGQTSNL